MLFSPQANEVKHLNKEKLGMGLSSSIGLAMATGGLDLLCVIPKKKVVTYGIPFLWWMLEIE